MCPKGAALSGSTRLSLCRLRCTDMQITACGVQIFAPFSTRDTDGKALCEAGAGTANVTYNMAIPPFTCKVVPVT